MDLRKNLLPFLLINLIVSLLSVLLALFIWNKLNPCDCAPAAVLQTGSQLVQPGPAAEATPLLPATNPGGLAAIDGVFGAGDLNVEYILLRNQGSGQLNLQGWQIRGPREQTYTLPNLTLNANGAVRLYSKAGISSVIELYWGAAQALWQGGDRIELLDSAGTPQASFLIP